MAQTVSFVGQELKAPMNFITEGGVYRLKVIKHEVDGYTQEGNEKNKYTFECNKVIQVDGKPSLSTDLYTHTESFNADEKQGWVFHYFVDAMKINTAFNPEDLVGRYVMAEITMRKGQTSDKLFANCSPYGYKYSKANDALPPIKAPEAVAPAQQQTYDTPQELIDEAELLF